MEIEVLLDENALPKTVYPTLAEPVDTKDDPTRNKREDCNITAIRAWRDEENRRTEEEKRLFKGSIWGESDKRLESKLFLSLGKQGRRYVYQKYPRNKMVDIVFAELWKLAVDTFQ